MRAVGGRCRVDHGVVYVCRRQDGLRDKDRAAGLAMAALGQTGLCAGRGDRGINDGSVPRRGDRLPRRQRGAADAADAAFGQSGGGAGRGNGGKLLRGVPECGKRVDVYSLTFGTEALPFSRCGAGRFNGDLPCAEGVYAVYVRSFGRSIRGLGRFGRGLCRFDRFGLFGRLCLSGRSGRSGQSRRSCRRQRRYARSRRRKRCVSGCWRMYAADDQQSGRDADGKKKKPDGAKDEKQPFSVLLFRGVYDGFRLQRRHTVDAEIRFVEDLRTAVRTFFHIILYYRYSGFCSYSKSRPSICASVIP